MTVIINGTSGITYPDGVTQSGGTSTPVTVAQGGTGATSLTANNVLLGNGTSALQAVAPGTNGNVLTSNGTTWTSSALPASGVTSVATSGGVTGGTITSTGTISLNTNNSLGIGSTQLLVCTYGTNLTAGSTISGSYLYYVSSAGSNINAANLNRFLISSSNVVNGTAASYTYSSGVSAVTFTQVGGTWRVLGFSAKAYFTSCYGTNVSELLFIRVS